MIDEREPAAFDFRFKPEEERLLAVHVEIMVAAVDKVDDF